MRHFVSCYVGGWGQSILLILFAFFCFAYPFAVIGVAFDVHPPFSLDWAGSALLFLEGLLLIVAASLRYGWLRGLLAGISVIVLSYGVEALGVGTGFPFGVYRYTNVLFPRLPGGVPLAVMFAWVLVVFGAYGCLAVEKRRLRMGNALLGAALAMLLDLEIEPVAFHIESYWKWLAPGYPNYYGVPLANFAAWFVVAFVLLLLVNAIFFRYHQFVGTRCIVSAAQFIARDQDDHRVQDVLDGISRDQSRLGRDTSGPYERRLAIFMPRILFCTSLFMFGLVDLTHGYYGATLLGILAGLIVVGLSLLKKEKVYANT
jgi:putative membrane protein